MKLLESKNNLALETAKIIFKSGIEVIFIGGTALNAFYLDYRYSEDLDLGYTSANPKRAIEALLGTYGYSIERSDYPFRSSITYEGTTIKLDVIEYKRKIVDPVVQTIGNAPIKTLSMREFLVEKTISFFTREEETGLIRDAYDLTMLLQTFPELKSTFNVAKPVICKYVSSFSLNPKVLKGKKKEAVFLMEPYLKKPVNVDLVIETIEQMQKVLA